MKKQLILGALTLGVLTGRAQTFTTFGYSQTDNTTGSGTINGFTFNGHTFNSVAMPSATVVSPGTIAPPAGFVGSITGQSSNANEPNQSVGLLWTGVITATATDGATIQIPLVFAPKVTQSPTDVSDYQWNISYGDSPANGVDAVSSAAMRFAVYFSRDTVIDATETPNTFQRYTQSNNSFVAGADTFSNTDTSSGAIKDATDPTGAPAGTDAAGRDLAIYFGWRDTGGLTSGAVLVDQFNFSGLLQVNESSLVVPEPTTNLLFLSGLTALLALRRRIA